MLFLFEKEQPAGASFWMYRTGVSLSIAFLDVRWVLRASRPIEPCRSWLALLCPQYRASVPSYAALEVNRGYLERRGIGVGDGPANLNEHQQVTFLHGGSRWARFVRWQS